MAEAEIEKTVDVSKEKLFRAITEYEKYPEFVEGVKSVKASKNPDGTTQSTCALSMMGKDMSYTLKLKENPESGTVEWNLVQSDFFKQNDGKWTIQSISPNQCKVKYWLNVEFSFPVPGFILKGIVKNSLPSVVNSFCERAKKI